MKGYRALHKTTIHDFHARLLRDTFTNILDDSDAFLLFSLFHTHKIELAGAVLKDRPQLGRGDCIAAITQRHCAEALASLWRSGDDQRAHYTYWYWRWNGEWGSYGHAEHLTDVEQRRQRELIEMLEQHPFIERIIEEDD